MEDLLESAEMAAAKSLAPGLTLHCLDGAEQQALAAEIAELVLQAPWFLPRMPRSGRAFSVKMTNCGKLGSMSDRDAGYRYQATHPLTGKAWPPIPPSVSYPLLPEACLVNFYDCLARMGHTRIATRRN
jgi:DNA oxidative demethylase